MKGLFAKRGAGLAALAFLAWAAAPGQSEAAFIADFEGFSVFGLNDTGGTGMSCMLCDATVSFAVGENEDGNWFDDLLGTETDLAGTSTGAERYVYLFQVYNTNPLGGPNDSLENFNVTSGPFGTANPFLSAGFLSGIGFAGVSDAMAPLDTPDDGSPSAVSAVTPLAALQGLVDPANALLSGGGSNLISHPGVRAGAAFEGALFQFNSPNVIDAGEQSSIMFLTSNLPPTYGFAETESAGGFGAAGDVPTPQIPAPAAFGFLLLGLGLMAGRLQRRA